MTLSWLKKEAITLVFFGLLSAYLHNAIIPLAEFSRGHLWGDTIALTYVLMWGAHALFNAPLDYYNPPIFHPESFVLPQTDGMELPALILFPLWYLFKNPVLLTNAALLLSQFFALAGCFYSLKVVLPVNRLLAVAFAIVFTASSDRFWHSMDHLNLVWSGIIPIVFAACWMVLRNPRRRHSVYFGVAFGLSVYFSVYFFVLSAITVACSFLVSLFSQAKLPGKRSLVLLMYGGLLAAIIALPKIAIYYNASKGVQHSHNEIAETVSLSASLTGYLRPVLQPNRFESSWYTFLAKPEQVPYLQEDGQFLGFSLIFLLVLESARLTIVAFRRKFDEIDRLSLTCIVLALALMLCSFGPAYKVLGISPYQVLYYGFMQFTGFFRTPARLAFIIHFLLILSTAVLSLKTLRLRRWEYLLIPILTCAISAFEHIPRKRNSFGIFEKNKLLALMDVHDPSGKEPFVSIGYSMYLYQALSTPPTWRPTVNGWIGGALGEDFSRRFWNFNDFPTTDTLAWLCKENVHWVLVPDPEYKDAVKSDSRLQYYSTDLGVDLYKIVNPKVLLAEYEANRAERKNYLTGIRKQTPDMLLWPEHEVVAPAGGEGYTVVDGVPHYTSSGLEGVTLTLNVTEPFPPGLYDEVEVIYQVLDGSSDHQVKAYWQSDTDPMSEKRGRNGEVRQIDRSAGIWKGSFSLNKEIEWMTDNRLINFRIDIFGFSSMKPVTVRLQKIIFKRAPEITIPYA